MSIHEEGLCRKVVSRRKRSSESCSKTPKKTKIKKNNDIEYTPVDPWIQNSFIDNSNSQNVTQKNKRNQLKTSTNFADVQNARHNQRNIFDKNEATNFNNKSPYSRFQSDNTVSEASFNVSVNSRAVPELEVTFVNGEESENNSIFSSSKKTSTPKQHRLAQVARVPFSPYKQKPNDVFTESNTHNSFNDSDSLFADIDLLDNVTSNTLMAEGEMKNNMKHEKQMDTKIKSIKNALIKCSQSNPLVTKPQKQHFSTNEPEGIGVITNQTGTEKSELKKCLYYPNQEEKFSELLGQHTVKDFDSDDAFLGDIDLQKYEQVGSNVMLDKPSKLENMMHSVIQPVLPQTAEQSETKNNVTSEKFSHNSVISSYKIKRPLIDTDRYIPENSGKLNQTHVPTTSKSNPPATPVGAQSLMDKLKQKLQNNAKVATPQHRNHKLQKLRLEEAKKEAEVIKQQISDNDIGPFYGLPSKVKQLLEEHKGISKLYDWQHECLTLPAVRIGKNLIYSLPTSGGKTLVAEILIMRELLCKKKDAILVLPFVSIVQEKVRGMSNFAVDLDFLVEEYAGSKGSFPPKKRRKKQSLYIATIEKANSLVNSFIEEGRIQNVGLVVVDELHMLGEGGSRGAILEMTLAKLRHVAVDTQIVGMSATLNNIRDLQDFLQAELYTNDFRPVELTEYVKLEDTIYQVQPSAFCPEDRLKHSRIVLYKYDQDKKRLDPDHLAGLVLEIIPDHSCLVFCPTKKNCENVADLICRLMPRDITLHKKTEKKALLKALLHDGNGEICPTLKRTIPYGVAYHHSGLTMDERKLIEEAYSEGTLCLLCCTSTLAAGVNLPAKRVILRSPYVGECFLSRSQYKQMIGRAGRAGIDTSGESILVLQKKDKLKLLDLVSGPCDSCRSSMLYMDGKGIRSLLLTTIGLKITESHMSVKEFLEKTLCHVQTKNTDLDIRNMASKGLTNLFELGLIVEVNRSSGDSCTDVTLEVTRLGRAVYKGSVDIDRGPQLLEDLCNAQESLCVANYLHLLYLVTPYDMVEQVNPAWMIYLDELSHFDNTEQRVATLVGVSESYVSRKATSQRIRKQVDEFPIKRFYLTLILYNLWKQHGIWEVSAKFKMPRGFIQQLLTGAASFASCVGHFCQELEEFWAYQDLLSSFVKKLSYCVTLELIPLMEIPGVKIGRARQLFNSGYKTLQQVAYADSESLVKSIEHMPRKTAKQIVASAQMLLQEKAETLRDEADEMITVPNNMPPGDGNMKYIIEGGSQASTSTTWGDMPTSQDI